MSSITQEETGTLRIASSPQVPKYQSKC